MIRADSFDSCSFFFVHLPPQKKDYPMKELDFHMHVLVKQEDELTAEELQLVDEARRATYRSYAPYSHFSVGAAVELADGTIITSEESDLLGPSAALILNATKHLAGIDHTLKLIPQDLIEPIQKTKTEYLGGNNPRLHTDEVLVALSVLSPHDDNCRMALESLPQLRDCQAHCTVMLSEVDRKIFKKLGVGLTCDPVKKR